MSAERMIQAAIVRADLWLCGAWPYLAAAAILTAMAAMALCLRR